MSKMGLQHSTLCSNPPLAVRVLRTTRIFLIGFEKSSPQPYAVLRRKAGFLFMKGLSHSIDNKAGNLTDWNGWIKLQTVPIHPKSTQHKAQVIANVNPDILLLQEIEDRASFEDFNQLILPEFDCKPFNDSFVIQGWFLKKHSSHFVLFLYDLIKK